jgi:hypothetical protein
MPIVAQLLRELAESRKMDHRADSWQFAQKSRWRLLAVRTMVVRPLAHRSHHSAMCQGTLLDMPQSGEVEAAEYGDQVFSSYSMDCSFEPADF